METRWDCVIVGGGAAGLSAALVLGRARKRTLVIDAGGQSNLAAHAVGGLLGHNGVAPAELYAAARRELAELPTVEVREGAAVGVSREADGFTAELASGDQVTGRRLLLATGMDYRHPRLPGVAERWGGAVFHCPFCHGWEVRDRDLGVLENGVKGAERALLLSSWSERVTLFTDGPAELDRADRERLGAAGIEIDERPVAGVEGPGEELAVVAFADGAERPCDALLVPVTLHQRSDLAERLGVDFAEPNQLFADRIEVDAKLETSVNGVFAAGDASVTMPSVANAIAAGSTAAAGIVHSLL
jgi:thioredoxin reductase